MIVSLSVISVRKGHEKQVVDILNGYVQKEKKVKGCMKVYLRKAIGNIDTFMVYTEYDTKANFEAANKVSVEKMKSKKIEFVLKPHVLRAFYGNFE
jgi:heme-degrading monooxygenase HmoA